jgi:hypothetical protein
MSDGRYQDLVLHEVPKKTIEHGVGSLLRVWALGDKRAALTAPDRPGKDQIQVLVGMAIPPFIFAAMACRYIGDKRDSPKSA